ncbi:MAG TPA: chemotaxis protein CheW [Gemmatimonadaceae bacterium]|nr:chemotaxis protein CheW [Gemmatimonadaceae bacterium]
MISSTSRDQNAPTAAPHVTGKYLTFYLGDEEYGLQILKVQEIIGLLPITRVPRTPAFVSGVINLRGRVIPIIDLRRKFGMEVMEPGPRSCVIVVQSGGVHMGLLVDRVSDVADIPAADIAPPPPFGASVRTDFLLGIGKSGSRIRLLLDIDQVLSTDERSDVSALDAAADRGATT